MPKPDFFLEFIHRIFRADHLRAQAYLEHFAECIESGKKPDKRVTEWMAKAIREHLDEGVSLEDAFALTKPRGRVRTMEQLQKEVEVGSQVEVRIKAGESRHDAVNAVAEESHRSPESVEKYLNTYRKFFKPYTKYELILKKLAKQTGKET